MEEFIALAITAAVAYYLGKERESSRWQAYMREQEHIHEQAWRERERAWKRGQEHPWDDTP